MKATILIFALLAISVYSETCDNPMAYNVNMSSVLLDTPSSDVSSLKYCKNLQSEGKTCCSSDNVAELKGKVTNLTSYLVGVAGARDKKVADGFRYTLSNISALYNDFLDALDKIEPSLNLNSTQKDIVKDAKSMIAMIWNAFKGNMTEAVKGFKTFQQNRAKCFKTLLDIQAAAYCLACDPDWSNNGVNSDGSINYSQNLCTRIQNNCFDYVTSTQEQNKMWLLVMAAPHVAEVYEQWTMVIKPIIDSQGNNFNINNIPGVTISQEQIDMAFDQWASVKAEFQAEGMNWTIPINEMASNNTWANRDNKIGVLPEGCTSASKCDWICTHFLDNGAIQLSQAIAGGNTDYSWDSSDFSGNSVSSRILENRFLADENTWDPSEDEAGITVTVEADPAGQSQYMESGSRIVAGIFAFAAAFLAIIFA